MRENCNKRKTLIMKYTYMPAGTCSRQIDIECENGIVKDVRVVGGCSGNLQGIAALCRGRRVDEVAALLRGIRCGSKPTSCPDQIAAALDHMAASEA